MECCIGEQWKSVSSFLGYEISSCGRLRSTIFRIGCRPKPGLMDGHIKMKNGKAAARVFSLSAIRSSRRKEFRAHRLVLEAFVGPCPQGMEACHNDGNGLNNHVSNLRWDTHKANMEDAVVHGTKKQKYFGTKHPASRLSDEIVRTLRSKPRSSFNIAAEARRLGVGESTLRNALTKNTWRHVD